MDSLFFAVEMFVRILNHHNRRIDHHTDGDGDAAQTHDIGVDADEIHRQ